jgi:hypothetical protein
MDFAGLQNGKSPANHPAVTLVRSASDTFAGIRPADAPGFIVAQLAGTAWQPCCFAGWCHRCRKMPEPWSFLIPSNRGQVMGNKKRVLILCTGNSTRSQMAGLPFEVRWRMPTASVS